MTPVFANDQGQVTLFYESGNYGVTSGPAIWPGLVNSHEPDENLNVITARYLGTAGRDVGLFIPGPRDFTGTLSYFPQDWRMLKFALGSCLDAGSPSPFTHNYSATNTNQGTIELGNSTSLPSFSIEDAQISTTAGSNIVRSFKGCMVDTMTLNFTQGEPVTVDIDYVAQTVVYASGAKSSVTANTDRPFHWGDFTFHLPSGTVINEVKGATLAINNSLLAQHYVNGSTVIGLPIPQARDITLGIEATATQAWAKNLYDQYFLGGSTFNMIVGGTAVAGSRTIAITLSGCTLMDMSAPSAGEGEIIYSLEVQAQNVYGLEESTTQYMNAGSFA